MLLFWLAGCHPNDPVIEDVDVPAGVQCGLLFDECLKIYTEDTQHCLDWYYGCIEDEDEA